MTGQIDTAKSMTRSSLQFLSGTMVSRVTGMLREIVMAFCFGTDPAIAAFLVAFRLSNLLRRVFGEGALTIGFIPHFSTLQRESPARATRFFRDLVLAMSVLLIGLIGVSLALLWPLYTWGNLSSGSQEIVILTAIMMPGLLFICLSALFSAFLQCEGVFFLVGASPVAFNAIWIAATWALRHQAPDTAALGLSLAVTLAFLMQWLVLIPRTLRLVSASLPWREWFTGNFFSADFKALVGALSLGIVGVCAIQINSAVDALFSRYASLEGPAYLTYAIRIQQFPLAIFAIAIASAALPPLSRAISSADFAKYCELLRFSLSRTFSLVFPCTVGLLVLGGPAINLAFGRGHFLPESVVHTTTCLFGYSIGLVPAAFVILMAAAFYSRKDYRTPTYASVGSVVANIALNAWFLFGLGWGTPSVAIATSLAAMLNALLLSRQLSQQVGQIFTLNLLRPLAKTVVCSVIAGILALCVGCLFFQDPTWELWLTGSATTPFPRDFYQQVSHFAVGSATFGISLLLMAWGMNHQDMLQLIGLGTRRGVHE
jgi:putative peptidoglycan lipid II flippase